MLPHSVCLQSARQDVITLQNPHGLPPASVPTAAASTSKTDEKAKDDKAVTKPTTSGPVAALKKEKDPWNVSPYSSGAPGASLTSTSVDPQTQSSKLLWDEEDFFTSGSRTREDEGGKGDDDARSS